LVGAEVGGPHAHELARIAELVRLDRTGRVVTAIGSLLLGGDGLVIRELLSMVAVLRLDSPSDAMRARVNAIESLTSASLGRTQPGQAHALHVDVMHAALANGPMSLAELCSHSGLPVADVADSLAPLLCSGAVTVNDDAAFVLTYR
jgi:hypothetical protein